MSVVPNPPSLAPGDADIPDLYREEIVAVLRLPIEVTHLLDISDLLEKVYGKGLTVTGPGAFLVVRRTEGSAT